jgi:hypothetical protein
MMAIDKRELLTARLETDTFEVDGVGSIKLRALNRIEAHRVQTTTDTAASERLILRYGVVDPELTETEILEWMAVSPAGEIERVAKRIAELSGISEGAGKSEV